MGDTPEERWTDSSQLPGNPDDQNHDEEDKEEVQELLEESPRGKEPADTDSGSEDAERPELGSEKTRKRDPNLFVYVYSDYTMSILKPVALTMVIVIWAVTEFTSIMAPSARAPPLLPFQEHASDSSGKKFGGALLNALIIVAIFVVVTFLLVLLYKCKCYKAIVGWFITTSCILLAGMGWIWFDLFCASYQIPYDWVTMWIILWNFAVVGLMVIYWKGAKWMTQAYLVAISCMMGFYLSRLPEWTTWVLLGAVALYDIVAVLTPKGPLKMLVEESQKRKEPIPGLVYESKSYKLGLGDFVFYSVLVGRASMYYYLTWAVCYLAVLMGLCGTLLCLGIFRRALPALPISIALGIVFYFITRFLLVPWQVDMALNGVWVA